MTESTPRSEDCERLVEDGLRFFGAGETEEAIQCWIHALMVDPENPRALDFLHSAGVDAEDMRSKHGIHLVSHPADHPPVNLAETLRDSHNADELFKRATSAYMRRDYRNALELFENVERLRPDDSRVRHNLSVLRKKGVES